MLFVLGSVLAASLVMAQTPATSGTGSKATSSETTKDKTTKDTAKAKDTAKTTAATPAAAPAAKTATKTAAPAPPPNAGDIASAKGKGLVWVNLNTKVYHGSGDKEYGTTKNGKFMTEADAKAAGAREAKR